MANWKDQSVLIVGGGIGGLSAALALERKGIASQVIEQAPEFKEIGAGIQLGPNVFRMFEVLGLTARDQRARGVSQQSHHDGLGHRRGSHAHSARRCLPQEIHLPLRAHSSRRPAQGAARGLPGIQPHPPRRRRRRSSRSTRPRTASWRSTESGKDYRGAALIGADGLWSTIRQMVVGDGKPNVAGHITYRAVLPTSEMPETMALARHGAVGRREGAPRALSAAHRRIVQPGRGVSFQPLRGRLGQLRRSGRTARALRQDLRAGAHAAQQDRKLAHVGAVRPAADQGLEQRPHHASRRRRASDAAISGAGRRHVDRGRGVPRRPGGARRTATTRRRSAPISRRVICAPAACRSWRASMASSITPRASPRSCAT